MSLTERTNGTSNNLKQTQQWMVTGGNAQEGLAALRRRAAVPPGALSTPSLAGTHLRSPVIRISVHQPETIHAPSGAGMLQHRSMTLVASGLGLIHAGPWQVLFPTRVVGTSKDRVPHYLECNTKCRKNVAR